MVDQKSLFFLCLILFWIGQATENCDSQQFPSTCPHTYEPVCVGSETFENSCLACQDPSVISYEPGLCIFEVDDCGTPRTKCTWQSKPICSIVYGEGQIKYVSYNNVCELCDYELRYFISGSSCEDLKMFCDPAARPSCLNPQEGEPKCAYYRYGCPNGLCSKTIMTNCDPCSDPSIIYYQIRECSDTINPNSTQTTIQTAQICDQSDRKVLCDNTKDEPVCAFLLIACDIVPTWGFQDFSNACTACQDPYVAAYTLGSCPVESPEDEDSFLAEEINETNEEFSWL